MDLKEIKSVIDLMTKNGLSEFELEKGDFKLRVKRGPNGEWTSSPPPSAGPQVVHHHGPVGSYPAATPAMPSAGGDDVFNGPACSQRRSKPPAIAQIRLANGWDLLYIAFARVASLHSGAGQEVQEETVVCIIEAMKVMNEIKAETRRIIVEVLAQNGKPVEFGKPLFAVRPA